MVNSLEEAARFLDWLESPECGLRHERWIVSKNRSDFVAAPSCDVRLRERRISCAHCSTEIPPEKNPVLLLVKTIRFLARKNILKKSEALSCMRTIRREHGKIHSADVNKQHELNIQREEFLREGIFSGTENIYLGALSEVQRESARTMQGILLMLQKKVTSSLGKVPLPVAS